MSGSETRSWNRNNSIVQVRNSIIENCTGSQRRTERGCCHDGTRLVSGHPLYSFTLRPRKLEDFKARNRYQQTSPKSHFKKRRLISKLTPNGRVTLTDRKIILTNGEQRSESPVRNSKQFDGLLTKYFHLSFE